MELFLRKGIIAATGLFLCLFLIVHLSANCILLLPEDMARELYNFYSTKLRENPFIKLISYVLMLSIILHAIYALLVTVRNKRSKPIKYAVNHSSENSTWASQNMGLIGIFILLFIVIHLANFWARIKLGIGESVSLDANGYKDVYQVSYNLFQNIYYVLFYSIIVIPLGLHLHHGLKSAFKTLGFYHKPGLKIIAKVALIYALIMSIGFGIIPFIVYFR